MKVIFNPFTAKFDYVVSTELDIPDIATTYFKLDQTTPQNITGEINLLGAGATGNSIININGAASGSGKNSIIYFNDSTPTNKWHIQRKDSTNEFQIVESGVLERLNIAAGGQFTLTGDLEISKVNPILKVTDTTAGNSAYIKKVDTLNKATVSNDVDYNAITSDVKLLLHMDGANGGTTFTDSSTFARTVTPNGSVTTSTTQFKFGTASALFTGAVQVQNLTVPHSTDFNLGTSNFNVNMWFYTNDIGVGNEILICKRNNAADSDEGFITIIRVGSQLQLYATSNGTSWNVASGKVIGTLTLNAWHFVEVYRNGSNWYLSLNGTQSAANFTSAASLYGSNTDDMGIGGVLTQNSQTFTGYIEEVYVSIGGATTGHTTNFTPPTAPWGVNQLECIGLTVEDSTVAGEQGTVTLGGNSTKSIINGNNPRFSVAGVEQFNLTDGAIVPTTDNDIDLGTATKEFKDLYIDGVVYADNIQLADSETLQLGTSQDLTLQHNGTNSLITNITGELIIGSPTTVTVGTGAAGVDYILKFDGETNDGTITFMEDEDTFRFSDDIELPSTDAIYLGNADTDGSWRMIRSGTDLSFERRESSSWVNKGSFIA